MKPVLITLTLIGCGMDIRVKDSEHDVNVSDSHQTITVQTTLDKILEICGIVLADGSVIPYNKWTDQQKDCLDKLDMKGFPYEQDQYTK